MAAVHRPLAILTSRRIEHDYLVGFMRNRYGSAGMTYLATRSPAGTLAQAPLLRPLPGSVARRRQRTVPGIHTDLATEISQLFDDGIRIRFRELGEGVVCIDIPGSEDLSEDVVLLLETLDLIIPVSDLIILALIVFLKLTDPFEQIFHGFGPVFRGIALFLRDLLFGHGSSAPLMRGWSRICMHHI